MRKKRKKGEKRGRKKGGKEKNEKGKDKKPYTSKCVSRRNILVFLAANSPRGGGQEGEGAPPAWLSSPAMGAAPEGKPHRGHQNPFSTQGIGTQLTSTLGNSPPWLDADTPSPSCLWKEAFSHPRWGFPRGAAPPKIWEMSSLVYLEEVGFPRDGPREQSQ